MPLMSVQSACVIFITTICLVSSARILGVVHMPAYSHFQLGDKIFRELAAKGHEVTVISSYELKKPVKNLKHVVITGFSEQFEAVKTNIFKDQGPTTIFKVVKTNMLGLYFTETVLKHSNVQKLLKSDETFDLVIFENFMCEAFTGFAHRFKAPHILLSSVGAFRWTNPKMGNPNNPAYVPDAFLSYTSNMNFFERMHNSLFYVGAELFTHLHTYRKQNELLQEYFPGAPHLYDLVYNASLILLNSHVSTSSPVPLVPNMIEIGGYHVKPPKPLPEDLKNYLDNAKDGVIFFSLGSNLKSKNLPKEKRDEILKVLRNLKQKVLWKWEDDVLPGQPPNVKLGKWLPQQDILAHPNIKLFITHGGLLSTIEAIYHGVPVVGIPVFGDQELNIKRAEQAGYGIGVPFKELNEASLSSAVNKVLTNKKYTENAKHRSKIMHDQPIKPLDKAIFWIEYVLRHQGAPHLKTAALNLQWYQYLLLDVVAAIFVGVTAILWILYKMVKLVCGRKKATALTKDKKKIN